MAQVGRRLVAFTAMAGSVLAVAPASAEPRNATGQCVAANASEQPGPPADLAHGEPVPGEHFPFTCPPPPGVD